MGLGKLILAYAAFQDRRHDGHHEESWRYGDKAQPVEELLDLRTQIDIKNIEEDNSKFNLNDYRNQAMTSTSYRLRKGMQDRQQRIRERRQIQSQYPHTRVYHGRHISCLYPNTNWRSHNYMPTSEQWRRDQHNMMRQDSHYRNDNQERQRIEKLKLIRQRHQNNQQETWHIASKPSRGNQRRRQRSKREPDDSKKENQDKENDSKKRKRSPSK
jgi:hypothetical protein